MRLRAPLMVLAGLLVLAAPAWAANDQGDNGEGLYGETTDKFVTLFSLGVVVFFVVVATIGTIIQSKLEKRKQEKKAHQVHRVGW